MFMPIFLLALLGASIIGCGSPTKTAAVPEPDYARTETETTLQGLSEDDLAKYTRYGDEGFKAAVTQDVLDKAAGPLNDQFGAYESLEYLSTETQGPYTIVHYKAKFAKGELGIRMVFDQDHLVAGQWFE
jgi:hypothetical protein